MAKMIPRKTAETEWNTAIHEAYGKFADLELAEMEWAD